jgi:hypothetical protein
VADGNSDDPSKPPELPTAQLIEDNDRTIKNAPSEGDTVVIGRTISCKEYARKSTSLGLFDTWHLVRVKMISVEKGQWDKQIHPDGSAGESQSGLSFVWKNWDYDPQRVRVHIPPPWPYTAECVWAFTLDTSVTPARIVRMEQRWIDWFSDDVMPELPASSVPDLPDPITARLAKIPYRYNNTAGAGDTVIVGQAVTSDQPYTRTQKDGWGYLWHIVRMENLVVEKGQWDQEVSLSFVIPVPHEYPSDVQRYRIGRGWPWPIGGPYHRIVLTLDTRVTPAIIVGMEYRYHEIERELY